MSGKVAGFRWIVLPIMLLLPAFAVEAANYRFQYEVKGDSRKSILIKEFRMYYEAAASALFSGTKLADGSVAFALGAFDRTGYRVRTHRNGEKLSIVTAAKSLGEAKGPFASLESGFKRGVPYYGPMVRTVDARPFVIGATGPQSFTFQRSALGAFSGVAQSVPMVTPAGYGAYGDSFNIYPIMAEIMKFFGHNALPAGGLSAVIDGSARSWRTLPLNFTRNLNSFMYYADAKAQEYVTFAQSWPFSMQYKVAERTATTVTVFGSAWPNVEIASGIAIKSCLRSVKYRLSDRAMLEDVLILNARTSTGLGWVFSASLKML